MATHTVHDNEELSATFDVFLSHNRRQKAWVRELVRFLRGLGLSVFFDEDSIMPGQDFLLAIEHGIERSRTLALVISRSALRSRWVSFETAIRLHDDPLGESKPLIPILAEEVDWTQLRASVRRLDAVDLTNPITREAEFFQFLRCLGVSEDRCASIKNWPAPTGIQDLCIADINSVLRAGWSGIDLLDQLIALDYEVVEGLTPVHEGDSAQWAPVFMNHPETWRLLTTDDQEIVGYWHFVPLFEEDYELARSGRLLDSCITADRIPLIEMAGTYDVYFVTVGIHHRYRRPKAMNLLMTSLVDVVTSMAEQGVFIRNVCANAYTHDGSAICRSLGMSAGCRHVEHGQIYESTMLDILRSRGSLLPRQLLRLYTSSR